jgi:hypothetical protein
VERSGYGGLMAKLSMDIFIEALFQAVLSEENKPLSVRHRQVKDRILEAEGAIRTWTKPKLSDPNNDRVLWNSENDFANASSAEPHKQSAAPRAT